jgi:hypothetical protein
MHRISDGVRILHSRSRCTERAAERLIRAAGGTPRKGKASAVPSDKQDRSGTIQSAEKPASEGGGGFAPRTKPAESAWALAPEGRFSQFFPIRSLFA